MAAIGGGHLHTEGSVFHACSSLYTIGWRTSLQLQFVNGSWPRPSLLAGSPPKVMGLIVQA